jgi:hypothetical protein
MAQEYSYRTWFNFAVISKESRTCKFIINNFNHQTKLFSDGYKIVHRNIDHIDNIDKYTPNEEREWQRIYGDITHKVF